MRCVVALVVALGACEFRAVPATNGTPPPSPDAAADDAASGPTDAPSDAASPQAFCDPGDSHLVACYEFENNDKGKTRDGSSHHLDATTDHASFPTGKVGNAMLLANDGAADVADDPAFNLTALTIEAWIKPSQLPSGGAQAYILDVNNQYSLRIESNGDLHCVLIGAQSAMADPHLMTNQWTHVACTYDSAVGSAIYVNGTRVAAGAPGGTLATDGDSGMSLAADNLPSGSGPQAQPPPERSRLNGLIDQVRLLDAARSAAQICADAGRSSCP